MTGPLYDMVAYGPIKTSQLLPPLRADPPEVGAVAMQNKRDVQLPGSPESANCGPVHGIVTVDDIIIFQVYCPDILDKIGLHTPLFKLLDYQRRDVGYVMNMEYLHAFPDNPSMLFILRQEMVGEFCEFNELGNLMSWGVMMIPGR